MRGHIRKRGARWHVQVYLGRDDATGKKRYRQRAVRGTRKDAERELTRLIGEIEGGEYAEPSKITVGEHLQRWLEDYAEVQTRPRTAIGYRDIVSYVIAQLGHIRLDRLTPAHIQHYEAYMLREGSRRKGRAGVSPNTVGKHHLVLSQAIEWGMRAGLVKRNVVKLVSPPKKVKFEGIALGWDQVEYYLEIAKPSQYREVFTLSIDTGVRRSECLALDWAHVDLAAGSVRVVRALHQDRNDRSRLYFEPAKTQRSKRVIPLPTDSLLMLRSLRERVEADRETLGMPKVAGTDLVFSKPDGSPHLPDSVTRAHQRIARRAGLPGVRLHDLRHTYATLLLDSGVDLRVASGLLGHASVSTTADIYQHPSSESEIGAIEQFNRARNAKRMPKGTR